MNFSNLKMHLEQGQTALRTLSQQRVWISLSNWAVLLYLTEAEIFFASGVFALKKIWLGLKD